jgi:hypothetical protein
LLGFDAGRSSLPDDEERLGSASDIREPGNASSFSGLCYRSTAADDKTTAVFKSGGTYSYPGDIVEFTISSRAASALVRNFFGSSPIC